MLSFIRDTNHAPTFDDIVEVVGAYRTIFEEREMIAMRFRGLGCWAIGLLAVGVLVLVPSMVTAQTTDTGTDTGTGDDTGGGAGSGIIIDAEGVLRMRIFSDPGGQVMRERIASARATLDPKISAFSKLRKISLNRLERAILDQQGVLSDAMRYLAGLQRVRYVFYYPDSKDIVLAGPAEGWTVDPAGRVVGLTSRRPVVQLQDLVVALRAFPPGGRTTPLIGCSIDPTQEGLASMQQFVRNIHLTRPPNAYEVRMIAEGVRTSLGLQNVTISGVSPKSHFAQVLVEADYRMKLIGIGLETPPVRLISYISRAKLSQVSRNAMQRWYFLPDYQCVRQSDDRLAMELVGDGVKLVGEDELVTAGGERKISASRKNRASQAFVASFTKKYPEMAERSPIYAELRNLIDLTVAAACIQEQDYCGKAGWKMEFFGSEEAFPVEVYNIPQTVESAVNAIWQGNTLGTPIGGGVQIQPKNALQPDNVLADEKGKVSKLRQSVKPDLAEGQWWWD